LEREPDTDDAQTNQILANSFEKRHIPDLSIRYDSVTRPIRELIKKSPHIHKNRIKKQKINGQSTIPI